MRGDVAWDRDPVPDPMLRRLLGDCRSRRCGSRTPPGWRRRS